MISNISSSNDIFSRQLGFDYGTKTIESHYGSVPTVFSMDNVACNPNVSSIQECSYLDETSEDCGATEGAGVICQAVAVTTVSSGGGITEQSAAIVERNKLLATIDGSWGPLFRVSLDLIIWSFSSNWANVLAFKGNGGDHDCCNNGDRVPLIHAGENSYLHFSHSINGNGNEWKNVRITSSRWYNIIIEQVMESNQVEHI